MKLNKEISCTPSELMKELPLMEKNVIEHAHLRKAYDPKSHERCENGSQVDASVYKVENY